MFHYLRDLAPLLVLRVSAASSGPPFSTGFFTKLLRTALPAAVALLSFSVIFISFVGIRLDFLAGFAGVSLTGRRDDLLVAVRLEGLALLLPFAEISASLFLGFDDALAADLGVRLLPTFLGLLPLIAMELSDDISSESSDMKRTDLPEV